MSIEALAEALQAWEVLESLDFDKTPCLMARASHSLRASRHEGCLACQTLDLEEASGRHLLSRSPLGTWPLVGATVPLAAGRRASVIDVEGLKRRPPSKVGGRCHEFRA